MSSHTENWKSRDEDSGRKDSRDDRSRRPAFGSPRSFSRADATMSSRKENWKSRDEDSGRKDSRDDRSRRPAFGSPRSFSRADEDQNWRRPKDESANQATGIDSRSFQDEVRVIDDRKVFFVPYYMKIREEEHLFEDFRNSLCYLGDYSEDPELKFSLEKFGFHYLDTQFRPDDSSKVKQVDFDLKVASDLAGSFKGDMRLFTNFLQWIASKSDLLSRLNMETGTKRAGGTFVARAPIFQKMLDMPFKRYMDCVFSAICISGSIYIEFLIPEAVIERIMKDVKLTEHDLEDIAVPERPESSIHVWSHKYEQYMCGEDITKGTVPNEQFRTVISSKFGPHKVLYTSPIDAVNPDLYTGERDLSTFVKLCCTSVEYSDDPDHYVNRMKPYQWILPMVLGGNEEMIAGFCDEDGIVSQVRLYTVEDLLMKGKGFWNLNKNFTFAVEFLDFVKEQTESSPGTVLFFNRDPGKNFVTCEKVEAKLVPNWFIEKLNAVH